MSVFRETMSPIRAPGMSAVPARRGQLSAVIPVALRGSKIQCTIRMSVSIGVAVLVALAPVVPVASASSSDVPPPDRTGLIMGFTSLPTPDDFYIDAVKNQFIAPTHPGETIEYVAVTTPEEGWPLTGLVRLSCAALGPRACAGLAARCGRMSRGGNCRGSSTSPSISRSRPGSPIWRRR